MAQAVKSSAELKRGRSTSGFFFSPRGTLEGESGRPWDNQERMFRTPCPDQGQPREPGYSLETSHWDVSISSESVLPATVFAGSDYI